MTFGRKYRIKLTSQKKPVYLATSHNIGLDERNFSQDPRQAVEFKGLEARAICEYLTRLSGERLSEEEINVGYEPMPKKG
jgi:hypothetical protein